MLLPLKGNHVRLLFARKDWQKIIVQIRCKIRIHRNCKHLRLFTHIVHQLDRQMREGRWLQKQKQKQNIYIYIQISTHNGLVLNELKTTCFFWVEKGSAKDIQIPIGVYYPRAGQLVHFHNTLNQLTSQVHEIFRTHIIVEAYYPSHQLQQFEAAARTSIQNLCRKTSG